MKQLTKALLLSLSIIAALAGCEMLDDDDESKTLTFENASRSIVTVYPLTTQWGAFSFGPTEIRKFKNVRDTDYRFEPKLKVQEGAASTERYVIFVDAPPIEKPEGAAAP